MFGDPQLGRQPASARAGGDELGSPVLPGRDIRWVVGGMAVAPSPFTAAGTLTGTFVNGTVSPINTPTTCVNERFNVTGTLAFNDGGSTGTFSVVLTHFRAPLRSSCVTYGAAVAGTLTIPSRSAIA